MKTCSISLLFREMQILSIPHGSEDVWVLLLWDRVLNTTLMSSVAIFGRGGVFSLFALYFLMSVLRECLCTGERHKNIHHHP